MDKGVGRRFGAVAAALALCSTAGTGWASDWEKIESAQELRALYSNKTFRGKSFDGTPTVVYYRADGKALWVFGTREVPRTWEIQGHDQVCYQDQVLGKNCVRIQRNRKNPREILVQQVGGNFGGFVTVEDGIRPF